MKAAADVGPEGVSNILVDESGIEPFGIEVPAAPALHVGMLGVLGIGDGAMAEVG
jgi:hypothetical protein